MKKELLKLQKQICCLAGKLNSAGSSSNTTYTFNINGTVSDNDGNVQNITASSLNTSSIPEVPSHSDADTNLTTGDLYLLPNDHNLYLVR